MSPEALGPVEPLGERHRLEGFDCGVADLNRWLVSSARVAQAAGTAATYVLCRGEKVVGYYALAMASVAHESAPSRLRRGVPDPVPVVLLARLVVDLSEQGRALGGHLLVDGASPLRTRRSRVRCPGSDRRSHGRPRSGLLPTLRLPRVRGSSTLAAHVRCRRRPGPPLTTPRAPYD